MSEINLFSFIKQAARAPRPNPIRMARRDSPDTSKISARIAADNARAQYEQIRRALAGSHPRGLDLHQLSKATGILNNTITARLAEMERMKPPLAYLNVVAYDKNDKPIYEKRKTDNGGWARLWYAEPPIHPAFQI